MLIKFLKKGSGDAQKAADYLESDYDWNGDKRKEVSVLYGTPNLVAKVANSLTNPNVYTSGVVAWAPSDKPTDQQILETLCLWRRLAFAGLEIERFCHSEVLHRDFDGGVHVHMFVARVDLETGKCFNPAPPHWERDFGTMQDLFNHKYGWANPNDPMRARLLQPGPRVYIEASRRRQGLEFEPDKRNAIHKGIVIQGIKMGKITNRLTMIEHIENESFEVVKEGRDYISIKNPDGGKNIRLKGSLYLKDRVFDRIIEEEWRTDYDLSRIPDELAAHKAFERFEYSHKKRLKYNKERFSGKENFFPKSIQEVFDHYLGSKLESIFTTKRSTECYNEQSLTNMHVGRAKVYLYALLYDYVSMHILVNKSNKEKVNFDNKLHKSNVNNKNNSNNSCPNNFRDEIFEKYKKYFECFELHSCNFMNEIRVLMSKIINYCYDMNIENKNLANIILDYFDVNKKYYINFININNKIEEYFDMSMSNEFCCDAFKHSEESQSKINKISLGMRM